MKQKKNNKQTEGGKRHTPAPSQEGSIRSEKPSQEGRKRRKIIPYNPKLKEYARQLRNNSTRSEIRLWGYLKGKQMMGYDFHRQKPVDRFILDFFCHELMLGIELDGITHQLEEVYEKDQVKENRMNEFGISVLRFEDNEVMKDMDNVLRSIEQYIVEYEKEHTPGPSQEGSKKRNCSQSQSSHSSRQ